MTMAEDLMRYDLLAQDALRGVVRAALAKVARNGLPGEHHLFIALDTRHPDTEISDRLRRTYPEEITIVLQHQFWNLEVREAEFSVDLTFDNVLERLVVPFAAVKGFFDPAVQFGLQFDIKSARDGEAAGADAKAGETPPSDPPTEEKAAVDDAAHETPHAQAQGAGATPGTGQASGAGDGSRDSDPRKVVSLDQFRKK